MNTLIFFTFKLYNLTKYTFQKSAAKQFILILYGYQEMSHKKVHMAHKNIHMFLEHS